jgi:hypothetical protein
MMTVEMTYHAEIGTAAADAGLRFFWEAVSIVTALVRRRR